MIEPGSRCLPVIPRRSDWARFAQSSSQGSRLTSSDPCLGKERLAVGSSCRTLMVRSLSGGLRRGRRRWRWRRVVDGVGAALAVASEMEVADSVGGLGDRVGDGMGA